MIKRPRSRQVLAAGTRACSLSRDEETEIVAQAVRKAKDGERVVATRKGNCLDVRVYRREELASFESSPAPAPPAPVLVGKPEGE